MPLVGGADLNGTASGDPTDLRFDHPSYRTSPTGAYLLRIGPRAFRNQESQHRSSNSSKLPLHGNAQHTYILAGARTRFGMCTPALKGGSCCSIAVCAELRQRGHCNAHTKRIARRKPGRRSRVIPRSTGQATLNCGTAAESVPARATSSRAGTDLGALKIALPASRAVPRTSALADQHVGVHPVLDGIVLVSVIAQTRQT
eukprot:6175605-Pleurochrysis_carterae.AAC.2